MRHYNKSLSHKNALLIFKCLFATILLMGKLNLQAQKTLKYEYEYDATGNRIACAVINVFDRNNIAETDKITENVFVDKDDMLIYPNPTKGTLKIESRNGEEIASCTIFDSNGRLLDKFFINSSSATIELSAYPRGFYIVNLEKKDKTINYKIIKE